MYSRLDIETLSYFREVDAHVQEQLAAVQGKNEGEEGLLETIVENVFEEMKGKEADIVCDAECSRIVERMLSHAPRHVIVGFAGACLKDDQLGIICSSYVFKVKV